MSTVIARRDQALSRRYRCFTVHRGIFCAFGAATVLVLTSFASPAAAATYYWAWPESGDYYAPRPRHKVTHREKAAPVEVDKKPFGDVPKGPLQIIISINQQKLHVYSDGVHVADSSVATGVPRLPTPQGVFSVIQKQVFHRSNIYSNAPMPYMQRITWSGVAMHEGEDIGHPASHGCIRMPHDFAARLYRLTKIGVRVIISRPELKPSDIADGHLFVHKEPPPETVANAAPAAMAAPAAPSAPDASAAKTPVSDVPAAAATAQQTSPPSSADPKLETPVASPSLTGDSNSAMPTPAPAAKLADTMKSAAAKGSPITVFISRKQGRLYVRQDFEPLFDVPVTIAQSDVPFGTHVFTALGYTGDDHTTLRWNVVSLPGEQPRHVRVEESHSRYGKHARDRHVEEDDEAIAAPPQTPAQILARLDIPADVMDAISELIVPGSSLVVSDQGLGGETGEGTDFIVVTR